MHLFPQALLLFTLNLLDALFTILWVRSGVTTEANNLMAYFLDMGNTPFLAVKIAMGLTAALVMLRWSSYKLAKYGLNLSVGLYMGIMGVHFFTGLAAFGYLSSSPVDQFSRWTTDVVAMLI